VSGELISIGCKAAVVVSSEGGDALLWHFRPVEGSIAGNVTYRPARNHEKRKQNT